MAMTPLADQFLRRLEGWARSVDDIRLILVVGSQARAKDPADAFSDVDVVLFCRDHHRYLDEASWLGEIGTPILSFREPTATGNERERRVLFSSGLDVDFSVIAAATARRYADEGLPPDIVTVLRRGVRVVIDKDGLAPRLLDSTSTAPSARSTPDADELIEDVDDFLYHCLLTARKAGRGELFVALQSISCYLRPRVFSLIRLHSDLVRGEPTAWYASRMIEFRVDENTLARLRSTCAKHEAASIRRALDATIDLHASLAGEIFDRLGLDYPWDAEARVRALIAEIDFTRPANPPRPRSPIPEAGSD